MAAQEEEPPQEHGKGVMAWLHSQGPSGPLYLPPVPSFLPLGPHLPERSLPTRLGTILAKASRSPTKVGSNWPVHLSLWTEAVVLL